MVLPGVLRPFLVIVETFFFSMIELKFGGNLVILWAISVVEITEDVSEAIIVKYLVEITINGKGLRSKWMELGGV